MATIYNAPRPRYNRWEWFKFIAIRTVFPPVLLWDLIKFGINKLFGELVGKSVLPAQNYDFESLEITDDTVSQYNEENLICEKHEVITHDKAHLDTLEIKHATQTHIDPKYQKYIINFVGNATCYEDIILDMKGDALVLQANVVGFNLRGVRKSTLKAKSKDNLVTDGIAQVQRLLDKGVSSQNITLEGHSLGAGIASLVAQHFHQLGQPINLFNGRSFSTITNFVIGHLRLKRNANGHSIGHKDSMIGIILGWLAKPFVKFGVTVVKWEINAGSAIKSIPDTYREYIVVRSKKGIRDDHLDDTIIPHYASIHKELTSERHAKKAQIDNEIANLDTLIRKTDPLAKPDLIKARKTLAQAREKIKNERKMKGDANSDSHNASLNKIYTRYGITAQMFFDEFIRRIEEDHAVKSEFLPS